jgi:hypothetical protein
MNVLVLMSSLMISNQRYEKLILYELKCITINRLI